MHCTPSVLIRRPVSAWSVIGFYSVSMSTSDSRAFTRSVALLESLSVCSACYGLGGLVLLSMLLGLPISIWSMVAAFSMAWFVYLLHRFRMAHRHSVASADRFRPLRDHARLVGLVLWVVGLLAVCAALMTSLWLPLLLLASVAGMLVYGWGADGGRPRDMLVVKNACVGVSMTCFWVLLVIASGTASFEPSASFWLVVIAMSVIVLADAMYCDLVDMDLDARTLSRTAPVQWGATSTRWTADVLVVFASMLLVLSGTTSGERSTIWFVIPLLLLGSQGVLRLVRTRWIRTVVDCRLLLLAASGAACSMWISSMT